MHTDKNKIKKATASKANPTIASTGKTNDPIMYITTAAIAIIRVNQNVILVGDDSFM